MAFTDDDCLPPVDWLTRLADGYVRYPEVAGVGGYLEAPADVLQNNILARYERNVGWEDYGARTAKCLAPSVSGSANQQHVLSEAGVD